MRKTADKKRQKGGIKSGQRDRAALLPYPALVRLGKGDQIRKCVAHTPPESDYGQLAALRDGPEIAFADPEPLSRFARTKQAVLVCGLHGRSPVMGSDDFLDLPAVGDVGGFARGAEISAVNALLQLGFWPCSIRGRARNNQKQTNGRVAVHLASRNHRRFDTARGKVYPISC